MPDSPRLTSRPCLDVYKRWSMRGGWQRCKCWCDRSTGSLYGLVWAIAFGNGMLTHRICRCSHFMVFPTGCIIYMCYVFATDIYRKKHSTNLRAMRYAIYVNNVSWKVPMGDYPERKAHNAWALWLERYNICGQSSAEERFNLLCNGVRVVLRLMLRLNWRNHPRRGISEAAETSQVSKRTTQYTS